MPAPAPAPAASTASGRPAPADEDEDSRSSKPLFSFKNLDDPLPSVKGQPTPTVPGSAAATPVGTLFGDAKTNHVYSSIKVGAPELRGSNALTQFHVYKVVAAPNPGVDAVWRRYRV